MIYFQLTKKQLEKIDVMRSFLKRRKRRKYYYFEFSGWVLGWFWLACDKELTREALQFNKKLKRVKLTNKQVEKILKNGKLVV